MNITEAAKIAMADGFAAIANQFALPSDFPEQVLDEAQQNIYRHNESQSTLADRRDATNIPFVTLDPASSTDLDQAFALEIEGDSIVLHYALADVGAFVPVGSAIEAEAWQRGVTIYGLPDKVPLYPKSISQSAASLLPDGPRPAILVTVTIDKVGNVNLRSIERVICASRAKLAYDTFDVQSAPGLEEFASRMWQDELHRGAIRVEFPQQEVIASPESPGGVQLVLRAREYSETVNSSLSLAVNLAIGNLFKQKKIGLFRVMDEPSSRALQQLRRASHALGIRWKEAESLRDLQRRLDPNNMVHQRFLLDVRRAGGRASYAAFSESRTPWHSAVAASYAHATAPMRRLADRYVLDLAFLAANDYPIPSALSQKISELPAAMAAGESRAANVDRAVIDLLEAVSLQHRIGEVLEAEVVDAETGVVQTFDAAIRSRATKLVNARNGDLVRVRIDEADPTKRKVRLTVVE